MSIIKLGLMEIKKLFQQREIYIALFLCTVIYLMGMKSIGESDKPYELWKGLIDAIPWIGFWFIAVLIVVGASKCLSFEREQEMSELLLTYKKGHLKLLIVKQIFTLIYCAIIVLYFYVVSFFSLGNGYSTSGIFAQIKVNPPFYSDANPNWTFAQLLVYQYGYTVLASYIFALFILALSFFINRSVFIMMIAGSIFAAGELYEKFIAKFIGTMKLSDYLGAIYDYGFNGMLSHQYLGFFKPFSEGEVYILFSVIALLLFTLNLIIGRWRRYASMGD